MNSSASDRDAFNRGNPDSNYINISEKDKVSIELLKILISANKISFISDTLSMQAAINGIKAICKKYTQSEEDFHNPDALLIYSIGAGILSRVIVTYVGYRKFQIAYDAYMNGDKNIIIDNFIKINFVNTVFLFGALIALGVAKNVYDNGRLNIFV